MKVQSIELKNYKRFKKKELDFTDEETGLAKDLIVLVGFNGAGKSTILQSIAATIGVATGHLQKPEDLKWPGYNYELIGRNWLPFEPEVNIKVEFSPEEFKTVAELHQKLQQIGRDLPVFPTQKSVISLRWNNDRIQADTQGEFFQFKGREYAKQLSKSEGFQIFERVGTIFWYTEQRNSTSLTPENSDNNLEFNDDILRDRLSKFQQFHQNLEIGKIKELRLGQKDLYAEIQKKYQAIFPQRNFEGIALLDNIDDIFNEPWFYLYDSRNLYELSEMSGGERAVFPIIMDFANWNIHNSIILIDEIELHLHPPMQQAFLRALPKLGTNNQFIITTHSDYIEKLVPETYIIRLEE